MKPARARVLAAHEKHVPPETRGSSLCEGLGPSEGPGLGERGGSSPRKREETSSPRTTGKVAGNLSLTPVTCGRPADPPLQNCQGRRPAFQEPGRQQRPRVPSVLAGTDIQARSAVACTTPAELFTAGADPRAACLTREKHRPSPKSGALPHAPLAGARGGPQLARPHRCEVAEWALKPGLQIRN